MAIDRRSHFFAELKKKKRRPGRDLNPGQKLRRLLGCPLPHRDPHETYGFLISCRDSRAGQRRCIGAWHAHVLTERKCINSIITLCRLVKNVSIIIRVQPEENGTLKRPFDIFISYNKGGESPDLSDHNMKRLALEKTSSHFCIFTNFVPWLVHSGGCQSGRGGGSKLFLFE